MNFRKGEYLFALGLFVWICTVSEFVYAGDSDLDTAFGTNGVATVNLGPNYWGENRTAVGDIALQSDGKIVQVGSYLYYYGSDFVLVRYTNAGVLDTGFGVGGKVITDLFSTPTTKYSEDRANSVAIQSDGKIIVAGSSRSDVTGITGTNFDQGTSWMWWNVALARYDTNGLLDPAFGTNGKVEIDVANGGTANEIYKIALQSDGKIVAVGYTMSGYDNRFLIMRFNSNGTLDTTFNSTGYRIEHFSENTYELAKAVAIQPDGKIVVAGYGIRPSDGKSTISILRLTSAGLLDSTFSSDGKLVQLVGGDSGAFSVLIDSNSKILVGGYTRDSSSDNNIFLLGRYNSNGTQDTTFGTNGIVSTPFEGTLGSYIIGLALQTDGKIVAYGRADVSYSDLVLARYNANGSLDTTFDSGDGKIRTDLSASDTAANVVLQPDGKILVSASRRSDDNTYPMLAVLRYGAVMVNPSVIGKGIITPSTVQNVKPGLTTQFTLLPEQDVNNVRVLGSCPVGTLSNNGDGTWHYTTGIIAGDCSVIAYFGLLGDGDNDNFVNLADAIRALQVVTGIHSANTIGTDNDVNGDRKVGLEEAIYVLQKVAGLR
jgi:uncharacterized delta-60 repeat protein